jgi:hypothetical protein
MAAVALIVVLLVVNLIVVCMVVGGGRDHELTVRRAETVRAFYAAEAGANMAIREMMQNADEDGDGTIGTISDDGNDATDPALGAARLVVTYGSSGGQATLTSTGRCGTARRRVEAVLE